MSEGTDGTVFRYSSPELSVEIRGEESFVREQIECMGILQRVASSLEVRQGGIVSRRAGAVDPGHPAVAGGAAPGGAGPGGAGPGGAGQGGAAPDSTATGSGAVLGSAAPGGASPGGVMATESAAEFFERCHARAGKGAHFDRVLLIGYWLEHVRGRKAFSKADIERTYGDIGLELPKHLDQVIGSIRRDHGLFEQAGRVGRYRLTEDGVAGARELGA